MLLWRSLAHPQFRSCSSVGRRACVVLGRKYLVCVIRRVTSLEVWGFPVRPWSRNPGQGIASTTKAARGLRITMPAWRTPVWTCLQDLQGVPRGVPVGRVFAWIPAAQEFTVRRKPTGAYADSYTWHLDCCPSRQSSSQGEWVRLLRGPSCGVQVFVSSVLILG